MNTQVSSWGKMKMKSCRFFSIFLFGGLTYICIEAL